MSVDVSLRSKKRITVQLSVESCDSTEADTMITNDLRKHMSPFYFTNLR